MKPPKPLRDAIRETAVRLWEAGEETTPDNFLTTFHRTHGTAVTSEALRYGFDRWLVEEARDQMKRIGKEAKRFNERQLLLPLSLAHLKIPSTLQVTRNDAAAWVPVPDASLADCEAYALTLQQNLDACEKSLAEFRELMSAVRPLLEANPIWRVGDALAHLRQEEERAA